MRRTIINHCSINDIGIIIIIIIVVVVVSSSSR